MLDDKSVIPIEKYRNKKVVSNLQRELKIKISKQEPEDLLDKLRDTGRKLGEALDLDSAKLNQAIKDFRREEKSF